MARPILSMPLLAATLFLLLERSIAFNVPRNVNAYNYAAQSLHNPHAVGMSLRLPATSNLQSPSSWMGGYLRAIDMHNGDLQISNRRGAYLS